ncbi:MAG: dynamin family protein [Clostridia bacterium]|nr:dynamin family protein [Clostridia bacterium]
MSTVYSDKYASFKRKRKEFVELVGQTADILEKLKMDKAKQNLEKVGRKIDKDNFKIQVVGTFKNGKSTFINSFLGEEILPAYALPCTAVINEVKYASEKKAVLHFKNPLPRKMPSEIPKKALEHMDRHMYASVPPLRIEYDEIEDYVVIPIGKDPSEMLLESPYSKVELYWPLKLLENGVEIIDSPGLNEHATRTKVTMEYLTRADAILFVLNAQAICTREEMNFVENNLKAQGFDEPYFVVNRFDLVKKEEDRVGMRRFAKEKLSPFTDKEIFFVSARNALDGKMEKDNALLASSGMMPFEENLAEYLTVRRGAVKLIRPAKELRRIIEEDALGKAVVNQRRILNAPLEEIKARYEKAKPKLDMLTIQKNQFETKMTLKVNRMKPELERLIENNYRTICTHVPIWLEGYKPKINVGMLPSKNKINMAVKEMSDFIAEEIDKYQAFWNEKVLVPFISRQAEEIFEGVDEQILDILTDVDNVSSSVSGREMAEGVNRSAVEYIKDGSFDAPHLSMTDNFTEKLGKSFAMNCLGDVLIKAFSAINPFVILTAITSKLFGVPFGDESVAVKKIKETLADEIISGVDKASNETTARIVNTSAKSFEGVIRNISSALDAKIKECDSQIARIIEDMEKGKERIADEEAAICKCEEELKKIRNRLDVLIGSLIKG